ncbi:hypothetical protein PSHI8_00940 [Polynucleobacter sp. SHI8]|nr:hypothetical protein PSHI2_00940 [Polynucleobacter sp. SHI2]BDW12458.1 hypothetical protein PSHI8_00940 [Polynucleobacter sp. SHI8]
MIAALRMPAIAKITMPKMNFFNMTQPQKEYFHGVENKTYLALYGLNFDSCFDYKEGKTSIDTF